MRQIWQTILNNRIAGTLFIILIVLFTLFMWKLISPESYELKVNGFLRDMWEIAKFIGEILIGYLLFAGFFRWPPFSRRKSGGH